VTDTAPKNPPIITQWITVGRVFRSFQEIKKNSGDIPIINDRLR